MSDSHADEERIPKEHGVPVSEAVDLGGPVARIVRTTYVGNQWTKLVLMVPEDSAHDIPSRSVEIHFSAKQLEHFLGRLAWPTR
jgi:hypothetical protein